jgi:hypothetical protein
LDQLDAGLSELVGALALADSPVGNAHAYQRIAMSRRRGMRRDGRRLHQQLNGSVVELASSFMVVVVHGLYSAILKVDAPEDEINVWISRPNVGELFQMRLSAIAEMEGAVGFSPAMLDFRCVEIRQSELPLTFGLGKPIFFV